MKQDYFDYVTETEFQVLLGLQIKEIKKSNNMFRKELTLENKLCGY